MDAARYFEMMHRAMSARKRDTTLLLRVKVQDLAGQTLIWNCGRSPAAAGCGCFTPPWGGATSTSSCSARAGSSATTLPAR